MGLSAISLLLVFVQGVLSFFSPCVLPLIPLYAGYLMGGTRKVGPDGEVTYSRSVIFVNTVCFVVGVSFAFLALGAGFSAVGSVLSDVRWAVSAVSGAVMVLFGLYMLGVFGRSMAVERERRLPFRLDQAAMSPLVAFVLGFTFSFAWTPCVGPVLTGVLMMASSSASSTAGFALVCLYALGFCLPFLALGLFTGRVLEFVKKHGNVVSACVKAGGVLLVVMGLLTASGFMDRATAVLSQAGDGVQISVPEVSKDASETGQSAASAPSFELADQSGTVHELSEYRGRVVVLDFFTTWCTYCKQTIPELQSVYEDYGRNEGDVVVLAVANPSTSERPNNADVSQGMVESFLKGKGAEYPCLMDLDGSVLSSYQVSGYPTTVVIAADGSVASYIPGAVSEDKLRGAIDAALAS